MTLLLKKANIVKCILQYLYPQCNQSEGLCLVLTVTNSCGMKDIQITAPPDTEVKGISLSLELFLPIGKTTVLTPPQIRIQSRTGTF